MFIMTDETWTKMGQARTKLLALKWAILIILPSVTYRPDTRPGIVWGGCQENRYFWVKELRKLLLRLDVWVFLYINP